MDPGPVTALQTLDPAQRSAVAEVLAEAFEHDPVQAWLFPNTSRRVKRLRRFYERDIALRLAGQATACLVEARAVAFWEPPGAATTLPMSVALQLAPCFTSVPAHHPVAAPRLLAAVLRQRPKEPHWYLSHLAVRPAEQRRGLGRTLLEWGIDQADDGGVGTYLETANPDNLPFYRSAGFSQVGMVRVGRAPTVWALWRRPTSSRPDPSGQQPSEESEDRGGTSQRP